MESSPKINYITRQSIIKKMRRLSVDNENIKTIQNMVEVYEPPSDVVMVYVNRNSEMSVTMQKPTMTPKECYETLQKEM